MRIRLALGVVALLACLTLNCAAQTVLTGAGAVHDLPAERAAKRIPVHLNAIVTYYEPGESTLFVQDATGAVYVGTTHPYPLHRGDLVKIDGVTSPSFRTIVAADPKIEVVGRGVVHYRKAADYQSYQQLMSGQRDCQAVLLRGIVRSAAIETHWGKQVAQLEIQTPGGLVQGYIQDFGALNTNALLDAEVELAGIVGGNFTTSWQLMRSVLYSSALGDLHVLRPAALPLDRLPLTGIDQVIQTRSIEDRTPRVRVRGVLTFFRPELYAIIAHDGANLFAATRDVRDIPLGTVVDVAGFADDSHFGPALSQAEILPTAQTAVVQPVPVSYEQAIRGLYADGLISLQGTVISQLHEDQTDTVILMVDHHLITAKLEGAPIGKELKPIPLGAEVIMNGICNLSHTRAWSRGGSVIFRLDLRDARDVRLIAMPSWWTVAHLLLVLAALLLISIAVAAWAVILSRKVARQRESIACAMRLEKERSRLLEAINSDASLPALLEDICRSVESLAPGLHCCCMVTSNSNAASTLSASVGVPIPHPICELSLKGSRWPTFGTFAVGHSRQSALTAFEKDVVEVGAGLANLAVEQRHLYEELNYSSTHDQLTGLPNRRLAEISLACAIEEAERSGNPFGVAYIDIDRFKLVNDCHGHKTGDLYLQQIAERLKEEIRQTDQLARIGGDEFLVVASNLRDWNSAELYRERLQSCFDAAFTLENVSFRGSASIGFALHPQHGTTAEALKRQADSNMYAAKSRRRSGESLVEQPELGTLCEVGGSEGSHT